MSDLMAFVPKADDPPLVLKWHRDPVDDVEFASLGPFQLNALTSFKWEIRCGSQGISQGGDVRGRSKQAAEAKMRDLLARWTKEMG